ncbi:copper amine oxidase N-terminal domain-containing protein [Paenibacillus beijingensis]|uniref:Copper amine oxidase-like N-terminal domain-containing protein n=1 Tax=Paenibacillus beijingensis TaxID=1126833 RepID=A0A0D5NG63_9BACL|nr:copper amine oxidase N-terminal domain-containing protein [Paenibacillus beijingensis]AJY73967.1 hypothetical protein VN24_04240 [Paenibacillus beijingensis]
MKKKPTWIAMMCMLVSFIIGVVPASAASASTPIVKVQSIPAKLSFDNKTYVLPKGQYVFMYQNRTYVPLRFISYTLKKNVKWDSVKKTVTVSDPTEQELLLLQTALNSLSSTGLSTAAIAWLKASSIQASFVFNGTVKQLPKDQIPFIYNNSIYVPVRFMSESVGAAILWDSKTYTLTVKPSSGTSEPPAPGGNSGQGSEPGNAGGSTGSTGTATQGSGQTGSGSQNGSGSNGGGGNPGGGGGGAPVKPSYESITGEAEDKLYALRNSCQEGLYSLAGQYLSEKDENKRKQLIASGQQALDNCKAQFEQIVTEASQKLSANGYSTDIINRYRDRFNSELNQGMELLKKM